MVGRLPVPAGFYCFGQEQGGRLMGSVMDELRRREAAARAEAEELRGRIAELAERLAGVEERLSRLVITREMVDEVLSEAGAGVSPAAEPEVTARPGAGHPPVIGVLAVPPWRAGLEASAPPQGHPGPPGGAEGAGRPPRAAPIAPAGRPTPGQAEGGKPASKT